MIRKIKLEDKKEYFDMSLKFYTSLAVIKPKRPQYLGKTFKAMLSDNPYIEGYIVDLGNVIAGYMLLTFTYSNELGGEVITLDELYIKDEFQGQGIGTQLMNFVETTYPNVKAIMLLVNENNKLAKKLYNRQGFEEVEYTQMIKQNDE